MANNQENQKSHGGQRKGAGRPKGALGRLSREAREAARATGEMPLDYMLRVMRDKDADPMMRLDAARAAAPFLHAKLAVQEVERTPAGPVTYVWKGMPKPATAVDGPDRHFVTDDSDSEDQTIQ